MILDLAKVTGDELEAANKCVHAFAAKGFRTLGVARAEASEDSDILGFIPLYDPPRVERRRRSAARKLMEFSVKYQR